MLLSQTLMASWHPMQLPVQNSVRSCISSPHPHAQPEIRTRAEYYLPAVMPRRSLASKHKHTLASWHPMQIPVQTPRVAVSPPHPHPHFRPHRDAWPKIRTVTEYHLPAGAPRRKSSILALAAALGSILLLGLR